MKRAVNLGVVVLVSLLGLGVEKGAQAAEVVTGTGTFTTVVTRISQDLSDCGDVDVSTAVQLVTRDGTVAFSGAISTGNAGDFSSTSLREACASPALGTFQAELSLQDATVAGRTGILKIEMEGVFDGDPTSPGGVRTRGHGTVTGVSGGLRGARGRIQFVGQATTTSSSNIYSLEITLK
jgi:hypothetical protein